MVTLRPYGVQTQASGISQLNSGGDGYIGNAGLQLVGQTLGGAVERGLGIDNASIQRQQAQETNRNKFEAEIERREQEQYIQSQKLQTIETLFNAERDFMAKSQELKQKSLNNLNDYPNKANTLFDKTMGDTLKNIPPSQKIEAQQHIMRLKQRALIDADDYARKTQIDVNMSRVQEIDNHLINRVNTSPESLNQAVSDYSDIVNNTLVAQKETDRQRLIEAFQRTAEKKHYEARLAENPQALIQELGNEKELTPIQQSTLIKAQKTVEKLQIKAQTELKENPVQFVFDRNGTIEDAISEQKNLPLHLRKVFTNDRAEELSLRLQSVQSVEEMQELKDEIDAEIEPQYIVNAFNQLENDEKLPREYKSILSLDPYEDATEMRYMFDALNSNKKDFNEGFKTSLLAKGLTTTDFDEEIVDTLSYIQDVELRQGVPQQGVNDINSTIEMLAKSHYIKHGDIDDAVAFARNSYLKNYHTDDNNLVTIGDAPVFLPKNQVADKDIAVEYLENYKENNANQLFYVNDSNYSVIEEQAKQDIMDKAYYGLSPDGNGLRLLNENGLELLDKNKQPIKILFSAINEKEVKNQRIQDIIQEGEKVVELSE